MSLLALPRSPRAVRLLVAASLVAAAGFVVTPIAPGIAHASGGAGPTGLHDGMMPSDSPDAQPATASGARPQASAMAVAAAPLGVDVSGHQHSSTVTIDWGQVAASGQTFAMVKATELYTDDTTQQPVLYTNPYLHSDLAGASAQGLVVGSYAFAHPENSAVTQADDFAAAMGTLPAGSLPPVLDLEETGGLSVSALVSWTQSFLVRLKADTGVTPMIYSSPGFWSSSMGGSTAFTGYPLWEANWTTNASPSPMGGWSTYTLWQFTDAATVPGISGNVDQDRFNGTLNQLRGIPNAPCGYCLDFNGDNAPDVIARRSDGALVLYPGNGRGSFLTPHVIGSGWLSRDIIQNVGDWDGDGTRDIIARDPSSGALWLYRGNGTGGFGAATVIGAGWGIFRTIIAPGDWNGDGKPDLIGIRSDGAMFLYAGSGTGGFAAAPYPQIGSGWQGRDGVTAVGDWDGDGHNDVIARDPANGNLWLYTGAGNGSFKSSGVIGFGWGGFSALVGPGDWDGDGNPDLLARRSDGALMLYSGNGAGGFQSPYPQIGTGWNGLTIANSSLG